MNVPFLGGGLIIVCGLPRAKGQHLILGFSVGADAVTVSRHRFVFVFLMMTNPDVSRSLRIKFNLQFILDGLLTAANQC